MGWVLLPELKKNYGGSQPAIYDSVIVDKSYLGPYDDGRLQLKVGETQKRTFQPDDEGPVYPYESNRRERKYDRSKVKGWIDSQSKIDGNWQTIWIKREVISLVSAK